MNYSLAVSNPPHGEVDPRKAAEVLNLSPAEARIKANYPAPEIWLAHEEADKLEAAARRLRDAGLRTATLAATDLLDVPVQQHATGFSFSDRHLEVKVGDETLAIPLSARLLAVYCRPPDTQPGARLHQSTPATELGRPASTQMLGALMRSPQWAEGDDHSELAFLDLYGEIDGDHQRISFIQGVVDVGAHEAHAVRAGLAKLTKDCDERFEGVAVDRRMENLRVRARMMVGMLDDMAEKRKLYSYGSKALHALLAGVSPDLDGVTQSELCSRLAYRIWRSA